MSTDESINLARTLLTFEQESLLVFLKSRLSQDDLEIAADIVQALIEESLREGIRIGRGDG